MDKPIKWKTRDAESYADEEARLDTWAGQALDQALHRQAGIEPDRDRDQITRRDLAVAKDTAPLAWSLIRWTIHWESEDVDPGDMDIVTIAEKALAYTGE